MLPPNQKKPSRRCASFCFRKCKVEVQVLYFGGNVRALPKPLNPWEFIEMTKPLNCKIAHPLEHRYLIKAFSIPLLAHLVLLTGHHWTRVNQGVFCRLPRWLWGRTVNVNAYCCPCECKVFSVFFFPNEDREEYICQVSCCVLCTLVLTCSSKDFVSGRAARIGAIWKVELVGVHCHPPHSFWFL